ncbi:MAG: HAD family hydrolase [Cyclobacteriaceae bacterium]|nr:HAD family hydrolase [Cyclobacteriaceae bacterium]
MPKNRCVFLDRDGVLNKDRPNYVYDPGHFEIIEGVPETLKALKQRGYLLIVVTNQAGIARGLYTREDMHRCHEYLQQQCGGAIDHFYYAPSHPSVSESLSRKPDSLLFEKAISRYNIDPGKSWMVGDRERDLIPAKKLGMATIIVGENQSDYADYKGNGLWEVLDIIIGYGQ